MNTNVARRLLEAEWEWLLRARDAIEFDDLSRQSEDESLGELSAIDQHPADIGSELFEREKDFSIRDQIDRDVQAVADAFQRLDRGRYGRCETCDVVIPDARLAMVPTARFCVEHERGWELRTLSTRLAESGFVDEPTSAEVHAEREALQHFDLLPTDDDTDEELLLSAEEGALHDVEAQ